MSQITATKKVNINGKQKNNIGGIFDFIINTGHIIPK